MSRVRLTVPGNILLLGEYAVLEEGGLGLAMAVSERVRFDSMPAETLRIESRWPGASVSWTTEHREASPLISSVVDTIAEQLGPCPGAAVTVDSTAFFSPDGRKSGVLNRIEAALRALPRPIIGRIDDGALLLDLRCLGTHEEAEFAAGLAQLKCS